MTRELSSRGRSQARRDEPNGTSAHRDAIVREARCLIQQSGYNRLTVDQVIQAAAVSRATFYFYFRNKKHLFIEVVHSVMDEMFDVAGRHYPDKDYFSRIVLANASYLRVWQRESGVLSEFFGLSLSDTEINEIYEKHRKRFEDRISGRVGRLLEQQRIPPTDPTLLAASLSSMVEFMAVRFFGLGNDPIKLGYRFEDIVSILSEAWHRAVYGAPAPLGYDYEQHLDEQLNEL